MVRLTHGPAAGGQSRFVAGQILADLATPDAPTRCAAPSAFHFIDGQVDPAESAELERLWQLPASRSLRVVWIQRRPAKTTAA